jgi:hypothetical protein
MITKTFTPRNGAKLFVIMKIPAWRAWLGRARRVKPHLEAPPRRKIILFWNVYGVARILLLGQIFRDNSNW